MGTELSVIPEIILIDKLEEVDNSLPPDLWRQLKNDIIAINEKDRKLPIFSRVKKKMMLSDFVNKAISLPLEIAPSLEPEVEKQLYRLHLFCCQQAVHNPEVRRNPLYLGFRALEEMRTALVAMLIAYRLIHPECPYSWDREFFEGQILTHKGPDGHTIIKFKRALPEDIINKAISEDIVSDWLIYRSFDHNGIRTLVDIKNNLLDIPNFQRGGNPIAEFSRFERKMQEKHNRKKEKQNDTLELEFRKKLVETAASQAIEEMLASGMSAMDLINQAFNGDLNQLMKNLTQNQPAKGVKEKKSTGSKVVKKQDTKEIENVIAGFLEDDSN